MGKSERSIVGIILICAICVMVPHGKEKYADWKEANCGIPDAVGSMVFNNNYHLTIVANSREIADAEEFACEVIEMCRENAFHSIKFSTDVNGYPSSLDITVYLRKDDIGEKEPVCRIRYVPTDYNEGYDIKNDTDKYHLYLDNKEIVF